jgi:hypothetical protein
VRLALTTILAGTVNRIMSILHGHRNVDLKGRL